jgi:arylsulfatase A-like enzyme
MQHRDFIKTLLITAPVVAALASAEPAVAIEAGTASNREQPPNFVIIFADDLGYQDVGCFGSPNIKTPHIDRLAREGLKFTDFYAQTVCGPSRAALMTGCYPLRCGRADDGKSPHPVLALDEITIAEVLRPRGYTCGMFGKWDLARHSQDRYSPEHLPLKQGFDYAFLTPSSNDAKVNLLRNNELIEKNADMAQLTRRYTDEAIAFIERSHEQPFFVYLAHSMPHTKLAASDDFRGKSQRGLYGDVVEEIDHNVGRIMACLKEHDLDNNTYVILTSDNGPWWIKRDHGGSAEPLRGAKTSAWDGGLRVPCVMRAPGKIPDRGETNLVTATIDLLPTIAKLAGAKPPTDRIIDGVDISEIMHGRRTELDRPYFFYQHTDLRGVRRGDWKLLVPTRGKMENFWLMHIAPEDREVLTEPALFNLRKDIGETANVAARHPEVVAELLQLISQARQDIGDTDRRGENARPLRPERD